MQVHSPMKHISLPSLQVFHYETYLLTSKTLNINYSVEGYSIKFIMCFVLTAILYTKNKEHSILICHVETKQYTGQIMLCFKSMDEVSREQTHLSNKTCTQDA